MSTITLDTLVGDLVVADPGRTRIFEHLGIDYCCSGRASLRDACQEKGLHAETVVRMLQATEQAPSTPSTTDWNRVPLADLIDHIVDTHHAYLRRALPRLNVLVRKVSGRHGYQYPWLTQLRPVFEEFAAGLADHMASEEDDVFPLIAALENAARSLPPELVNLMEDEHREAGEALATMRTLTSGFTPPEGACNSFRALLHGLAELEADMHQHVHKENNILFPRARALAS